MVRCEVRELRPHAAGQGAAAAWLPARVASVAAPRGPGWEVSLTALGPSAHRQVTVREAAWARWVQQGLGAHEVPPTSVETLAEQPGLAGGWRWHR